MIRLEWLFLMQIAMGLLMIVFLQKQIQIKKQIDNITKEINDYLTYIANEESENINSEMIFEKKEKNMRESAQNQLIQSVLSEYFP